MIKSRRLNVGETCHQVLGPLLDNEVCLGMSCDCVELGHAQVIEQPLLVSVETGVVTSQPVMSEQLCHLFV